MADNLGYTPGTGATIAANDISGIHYQRMKISVGAPGSATDLAPGQTTAAASIPVVLASDQILPLPADAATQTTLALIKAKTDNIDVALSTRTKPADAQHAIIDSGAVAATQSGTWTVQPGNTANTTAWKVDGSAVTQPVSAASLPLPSGAATSAKQDTGNTSTASIDTKIPALGQALAAASVPVVLTAAQIATLTPPAAITGFATEATLSTLNGKVTAVNTGAVTISAALPAGTNAIGKLAANSGVDIGDVDVASVSGNVTVVQPTGTNLHTVIDSGTVSTITNVVHVDDNAGSLTVDGSVTVTQATGTNLHAVVDSGTITTVGAVTAITNALPAGTNAIGKLAANSGVDIGDVDVASVAGNVTVVQATASNLNAQVVGAVAHDAAVSGNPVLIAGEAKDTLGTAVTAGDVCRIATNRYGMKLVSTMPPSHASSNGTPIAATTTAVIAAPSAGSHLRIVRIHLSNGGAASTWVAIRDGAAGTQYYRTYLPQNGVISLNLNSSGPLDLTSATRLDIVLSAAGSVEYTIDYLTVAD